MNHKPLIPLITLLKILNKQFDPEKQRRLEIKAQEDSVAFARLQRLRDTVGSATTLNLHEKSFAPTDQEYELQRIAAFLDETLSEEESRVFENECWESENLLHDVVVLFRAGLRSDTPSKVDSVESASLDQERQLRNRLVGLFPAETPAVADSDDESNVDFPSVVVPDRLSKQKKTKPMLSNSAKFAIAIAAALAMIAFSIVIANWDSLPIQPTDVQPKIVVDTPNVPEDADNRIPSPKVVESERRDEVESSPDSLAPEQIVDLPNTDDQPRDVDKTLPDIVDPKTQIVRSPDSTTDSDEPNDRPIPQSPKLVEGGPVKPATQQTKLHWSWGRVEGLVATRTGRSPLWSGASPVDGSSSQPEYDTDNPETDGMNAGKILGMECKVLPLSWGQASVKGMGTWTVTENTDFSVRPLPARRTDNSLEPGAQTSYRSADVIGAKINLRRGGLAISNANVGSAFLIETTTGNWRIRITGPATVVMVEQLSASRLVVQNGSISVNGEELRSRQQLVRSAAGKLEQIPNRNSIKWLKKPLNKFPSKQLSAQWQASRDLFTDLSQPDVISPEDQPLVRFAFATIDPPGQAKLYLANVLPEVRAEGIQWLLSYGSDPRQLRRLTNELATQMNTPDLGKNLAKMVLAIQAKRLPDESDAKLLVRGLQNRNVSVRRLSHGLLVHMFGAASDYNPESNPATLAAQARQWSDAVNKLYRRVEHARQ